MPRNATSKGSSKTSKSSPRASSKGSSSDALHVLAEDHKKVLDMFEEFEEIKNDPDEEAKQLLIETACAELTIHAQVEEEIFYPAAREVIDEMDLLDEAEVEHASARQLITELAAMEPDDDLYDAKFTVLGEYVKHHIQEEEKELFPKLKKAEIDLDELGEEIRQRKLELREELGVPTDDLDVEEDEDSSAKGKSHRNIH
ncbi:MAG TPA: hemerythrin domain-containing protein [Noviherbaspirillum sp.]|uniref:hemerythrin domain-containing protein n=1 Tax=Oxalobacteraceae TaxID=75682 RepID=UPI0010A2DBE8|nr:hemerythrin domain-containing protein [Herbaspirillum sp. ST 5-3]HJV51060.1 hemerythrin domain-containing protein [Noviherbaspirillum sp.]